jgi:hypothetical protein
MRSTSSGWTGKEEVTGMDSQAAAAGTAADAHGLAERGLAEAQTA